MIQQDHGTLFYFHEQIIKTAGLTSEKATNSKIIQNDTDQTAILKLKYWLANMLHQHLHTVLQKTLPFSMFNHNKKV